MSVGVVNDLLCGMADRDLEVRLDPFRRDRRLQLGQQTPMIATRVLDHRLGLDVVSDLGRPAHREHVQFSAVSRSQFDQILAISVGTTALAITAATKAEYCAWVTMPCDRPNSEEMVPKVRPVDISSVVYIPSLDGDRNAWVTG